MPLTIPLDIPEVTLLSPTRHEDQRGYFQETFNQRRFAEIVGREVTFVQDNESLSRHAHTVRGLHYQRAPFGQGKLVRVLQGAVVDVVVDIRPNSATYLKHLKVELSAREGHQLWIPAGMAHGFCTTEPNTVISYKVTDYYNASADRTLHWRDKRLGIHWPVTEAEAVLSTKDAGGLSVAQMELEDG